MPDYGFVNCFLFPAPASSYSAASFPGKLVWIPKNGQGRSQTQENSVPALLLKAFSARFLLVYFHSNAEDLGRCYKFATAINFQFQLHVLIVEYPGYGICSGRPCEKSVMDNAYAAMEFVIEVLKWPVEDVIIMGRSVGTGPATKLASMYKVHGLVLVCPFSSVQRLCHDFLGPVSCIFTDQFPNEECIRNVQCPVLIIHGKADRVVHWTHSVMLYEGCKARKRLVSPILMQHNTCLHSDPSFFVFPMIQFFALPDFTFHELEIPKWAFTVPKAHSVDNCPKVCSRCIDIHNGEADVFSVASMIPSSASVKYVETKTTFSDVSKCSDRSTDVDGTQASTVGLDSDRWQEEVDLCFDGIPLLPSSSGSTFPEDAEIPCPPDDYAFWKPLPSRSCRPGEVSKVQHLSGGIIAGRRFASNFRKVVNI